MNISPVSFGSLMVGRTPKPGNQAPIKELVALSFPESNGDGGNPMLRNYRFDDKTHCPTRDAKNNLIEEQTPDGTVFNAFKNYALKLDDLYRKKLDAFKNNPQKVIFTEVDFYISPRKTEKRYFLTAATEEDEIKIHKVISESRDYLTLKW